MHILEPTTVATDYILGVMGLVLGRRLWRSGAPHNSSRSLWGAALIALAVAAFAGGTSHGFADRLGDTGDWVLWRITVWSVGVGSRCLAAAMARFAFSTRTARIVVALFGLQFTIYAVWMLRRDDFGYVILEYVPAMIFVLATAAWLWSRRGWPGGSWVAGGIVISFVAAGVQASGLGLHQHFNHNDLYHVIQMVGVCLLYRGGEHLEDRGGHPT